MDEKDRAFQSAVEHPPAAMQDEIRFAREESLADGFGRYVGELEIPGESPDICGIMASTGTVSAQSKDKLRQAQL